MSDLITTAQDKFRDECIEAFVGLQSYTRTLVERAREQRGQTAAEYMGILFIVAAIIAAIFATPLASNIAKRVGEIVDHIGHGQAG